MLVDKRFRALIEKSFGTDPREGWSYYNGENRLDRIRRFHDALEIIQEEKWVVDDTTWSDLEMDKVFLRVNHTNSFIGEQSLYHRMRVLNKGLMENECETLEKRLSALSEDPKLRTDIEIELQGVGKMDDSYYLADFLLNSNRFSLGSSLKYHCLQAALVVSLVLGLVYNNVVLLVAAAAIALTNLLVYMRVKQEYEILFTSLINFKKVFEFVKWLDKRDKDGVIVTAKAREALQALKQMSGVIAGMNGRRQGAMTGEALAMIMEYIWGILLIDVSLFNHMMKITENKREKVLDLLEFVGEVDSDIAVLSYRSGIESWCCPSFSRGEEELAGLNIVGVAHPLIKTPVVNDLVLGSRAVITGSNASGKSTFMKSVAINCILAQTINTCVADSFALQPMQVMTCMALRDDIITGESYYFREAKCLKRMLELIDTEARVLVVVDEILKGTNTTERIAASKAILEYIGQRACLALVATHDNELTDNPLYENYHFRNEIRDGDIVFDYRIHKGKSRQSNAIALLAHLGYPDEVVKNAQYYVGDGG